MKGNKSLRIIALSLSVTMFFAGCSLPFFRKESRVSPDKVFAACEKYDAEDYDDLDELIGDISNNRAMASGMFIKAEGKEIRHALNDDTVNEAFADVTDQLFYNLYAKSIESLTMMIKSKTKKDGGTVKIAICSAGFENEDDAWKYYKQTNSYFGDVAEGDRIESTKDRLSDKDLEATVTEIFISRSASCFSVYIDGDSVMVLMGFEKWCNDIDDELDAFCELLDVPAPDMSDWDCTSMPEVTDRIDLLLEEYDFTVLDPDTFEDVTDSFDANGNYYTETTDREKIEDIITLEDGMFRAVCMMRAAYMIEGSQTHGPGSDYSAVYFLSFHFDSDLSSEEFYNDLKEYFMDDNEDKIVDSETNTVGGITYTKLVTEAYIKAIYGIYLDGDDVYLVGLGSFDEQTNQQNYDDILTGILGLP